MRHWNYRVVKRHFQETNEDGYAIHEAYYNDKGEVNGITIEPVAPQGNTLEELQEDCQTYLTALSKPILDANDIEALTQDK